MSFFSFLLVLLDTALTYQYRYHVQTESNFQFQLLSIYGAEPKKTPSYNTPTANYDSAPSKKII